MKILLCGASGFVGMNLSTALHNAIVRGIRKPESPDDIAIDYCKDTDKEAWLLRLADIDSVINAVGVKKLGIGLKL